MLLIFYSGRLSNLGQQGVIGGGEAGERDNWANEAASKLFKSNLLDILFWNKHCRVGPRDMTEYSGRKPATFRLRRQQQQMAKRRGICGQWRTWRWSINISHLHAFWDQVSVTLLSTHAHFRSKLFALQALSCQHAKLQWQILIICLKTLNKNSPRTSPPYQLSYHMRRHWLDK